MLSVSAYDVNENPINTNVDYIIQVLETDQQLVESLKLMNYNSTYVCGFIDLETQEWSTSGCYVAITDVTVCRCNHLTSFAVLMQVTSYEIFCKFTSVALHLLLMNIFFWMFGEAVFLVFKVVYRTPSRYNRLRNYMLFCYLVPVILVSPVAIVMYDSYGNDYCWLDTELTWIILIPASLLVLFSMAVLIMMVHIIYRRAGTNVRIGRTEQEDHRQLKKSLKGALFLVPILGVTWIFGPLMAVTDGSPFMQYLFVILNSLQGVFIFIVYCLLDNEVQAQWKFMRKSQVHTTESTQTTL
ncbi:adhesion G-protein coupled receptor D1-like [Antedon mediterranea]|uniref:adhesion G-protein coupled receptor D1-like n=1 Tax=Antedon mediterranea TaxID=105859 RepID=UPI003AF56F42